MSTDYTDEQIKELLETAQQTISSWRVGLYPTSFQTAVDLVAIIRQLQRQRDEKDEALRMAAWNVENAQEQLHKKVEQLSELRSQLAAAQAEIEELKKTCDEWLHWADRLTGNQHYLPSKMRREISRKLE